LKTTSTTQYNVLLLLHGAYLFVTGLWPLVHIQSFMAVTGYKTDQWLVKTVGALLLPMVIGVVVTYVYGVDKRPIVFTLISSTVVFISIDFYYALQDVIANVYMIDGVIQILLLVSWLTTILRTTN
jgi:hypothetical protein